MKTKIAYLISTLDAGGAERQLINDVNSLPKSKYEPKVFVLKNRISIASQLNPGIEVEVLNVSHYINVLELFPVLKKIRTFNPDILHSVMYASNLIARFYKMSYKNVMIINHIHGLGSWIRKPHIMLDRLFLKYVDKVVVVSKKSKELRLEREGYPEDLVTILYNAIDTNKYRPETKKANRVFTLGTASRLVSLKQIDLALDLVHFLILSGLNLKFKIAGTGDQESYLKQKAEELEITDNVQFIGFIENMPNFYKSIDCFIICSKTEDLPLSIIEAFATGLRVIAPRIGGIPELVEGRDGIIINDFRKQKNKKLIKKYIISINNKPYSKINRTYAVKKFDNRVHIKELETLYSKLIAPSIKFKNAT